MRNTTRHSLQRAWRMITWPLSGHIALALATGLGGGVAAGLPGVVSPAYAAVIGIALYPAMVAIWQYLH